MWKPNWGVWGVALIMNFYNNLETDRSCFRVLWEDESGVGISGWGVTRLILFALAVAV